MEINTAVTLNIVESSRVAEAQRKATYWAMQAGFDEVKVGRFAIVVSEAATNLHKHANGGELIINILKHENTVGLEMFALDSGRGMDNVYQSMKDGHSTAGTAGTGLGAMQRQADEFDIFSVAGKGTVVWARIWSQDVDVKTLPSLSIDGISIPVQGETECGDGWISKSESQGVSIMVSDGLGHGPQAAAATREAKRIFMARENVVPSQMLEDIHRGIRGTRGAAIAIALLDEKKGHIDYCGVGNISGAIIGQKMQYMVSHSGTIGHTATRFRSFSYAWPDDAIIVMYSDGLQTRLTLDGYAGLARRNTALIAGLLYRDFKRGRDDATVVTVRRRIT